MPGSAKSLRVILCKIAPDKASAIPANIVMMIRGKRMENRTNSSLNVLWQNMVGMMRLYDNDEAPIPMLIMVVRLISITSVTMIILCSLRKVGCIIYIIFLLFER